MFGLEDTWDDIDISHHMTVKELKNILNELDDDCDLWPNAVNNILVCDKNACSIGYIDFNNNEKKYVEWEDI